MGKRLDRKLFEAVENGDLAGVKAAIQQGANINVEDRHGHSLSYAALSTKADAFAIVQYLVENGADVNLRNGAALRNAAWNTGLNALAIVEYLAEQTYDIDDVFELALGIAVRNTNLKAFSIVKCLVEHIEKRTGHNKGCARPKDLLNDALGSSIPDARAMLKYFVEHGADIHYVDNWGETVLAKAIHQSKFFIADYLLFHDDFLLSDLMPHTISFIPHDYDIQDYDRYRGKAISHVLDSIETKGISYARRVAGDIKNIMEKRSRDLTRTDVEALEPVVRKLSPIDWAGDARASCGDFMGCDVER